MREAYFDESSSTAGGKPLLIVAGFVAEKEHWTRFEDEWRQKVLASYKITHLHSKQLRSQNDRLYRHMNLEQRKALLLVSPGPAANQNAYAKIFTNSDMLRIRIEK